MARIGFAWCCFFRRSRRAGAAGRLLQPLDFGPGPWQWTTRTHEAVGLGDLVVLSLPDYPAVVGRVSGKRPSGQIHCILVYGLNALPGDSVDVEEQRLLAKVDEAQLLRIYGWRQTMIPYPRP